VLRVPVRVVAVTVFAPDIELLFITIFPPILIDVRVPRDVILACAAVLRVPVRVVAVTVFAPDIELLFITIFPPILREVRVPTLVKEEAVIPLANVFPDKSAAAFTVILALGNVTVRSPVGSVNASVVENEPLLALNGVAMLLTVMPVEPTVKEVRVPTDVILPCAAVLRVPLKVVALIVPVTSR
jgi:hypothetical protein